jgi:hypothetical protein
MAYIYGLGFIVLSGAAVAGFYKWIGLFDELETKKCKG